MISKRLMGAAAAAAFALGVGQAHAAVFTLDLTATGPTFSSSNNGGIHTDRFDVGLDGFNMDTPVSVQVGDEVIINLDFTDGPVTLPSATNLSLVSFFLSGDGFPSGDTETHGTTTLFNGGVFVISDTDTATTSGGLTAFPVFHGPVGALTFDSITSDFFINKIDGSTDKGTFGDLTRGSLDGEARNFGAAPEPAAWAMMLMGFGGMGAMLRTRRRKVFA